MSYWLLTASHGDYSDATEFPVCLVRGSREDGEAAMEEVGAWVDEVLTKYGEDFLLDGDRYNYDVANLPGPPRGVLWDWSALEFRRLRPGLILGLTEVPLWRQP